MKLSRIVLLAVLFLGSCGTPTAPAITPTLTPQPTTTETPAPTSTPTPVPTLIGGGSGKLIFEWGKEQFGKSFPDLKGETNVFTANLDGTDLVPVTDGLKGYNSLQGVSPDGSKVLVASYPNPHFDENKDTTLYSIDLNSRDPAPVQLTDGLSQNVWQGPRAEWVDNKTVAYVGQGAQGYGIYLVDWDSSNPRNIYKYQNDGVAHKPVGLLAMDRTRVYWYSEVSTSLGGNRSTSTDFPWWTSLDGSEQEMLEFKAKQITFDLYFFPMVFSRDGSMVAWMEPATPKSGPPYHNYLHIAAVSATESASQLETIGPWPILRWWPDGSRLLVFDAIAVSGEQGSPDPTSDMYGVYEVLPGAEPTVTNFHLAKDTMYLAPKVTGSAAQQVGSFYDSQGLHLEFESFSPDGRQIIIQLPCQIEIVLTKFSSGSGGYSVAETECDRSIKALNLEPWTSLTYCPALLSPRRSIGSLRVRALGLLPSNCHHPLGVPSS